MAGGVNGIWKENGLPVTPYLVPQDCGVHMETKTSDHHQIYGFGQRDGRKEPISISFEAGERDHLHFPVCLHGFLNWRMPFIRRELPPARRTVVCILGAVRGVGGIDKEVMWKKRTGSLAEKTISYDFWIRGLPTGEMKEIATYGLKNGG